MNKPTDYPVQANQINTDSDDLTSDITFAQLKIRVEAKQPVTEEMIRAARAKLDSAHTESVDVTAIDTQNKFNLSSIRNRFRPS